MKHIIVSLGLLLACAIPCAAQKASGPFADVSLNTWPYAAAQALDKAGIIFGPHEGTYTGRRVLSRYQFSVYIKPLLAQLLRNAAEPQADVSERLRQSPTAVNALSALTKEFSPELIRLGQDVPKAAARLEVLQEQQRQDVHNGKIVLTAQQLSSPFADIPFGPEGWQQTWQYAQIVQGAGVIVGVLDESFTGGLPYLTRLQMAQSLVRLESTRDRPDLSKRLQKSPKAIAALNVLSAEFTPELKLLGMDMSVYEANLADLAHHQPLPLTDHDFIDVPANHWAWQAVDILRQNGIIAGFPQGTFTLRQ